MSSSMSQSATNAGFSQSQSTSSQERKVEAAANAAGQAPENNGPTATLPSPDHDAFARQIGFESYLALFETSTPVKNNAVSKWMLTSVKNGQWAAWNAADLRVLGTFPSEEEAERAVMQADAVRTND